MGKKSKGKKREKWNATPKLSKKFEKVNKFGVELGNGIVLCMVENIMAIYDNNYYVPIEYV